MQEVLFNLCNNSYGIRYSKHYLRKSYRRDIDRSVVDEKLLSNVPTVMPKDKKEATLMESFKLDYIYDYEYDLVDLTIKNDFKYLKSIEMCKGIILDFDENYCPVAIEMISASKILGIDKQFLVSPDIDMLIDVSDDSIKIEIKFTFLVNKIERDISFKQNIANIYGIPSIETLLSTV